MLIDLDDSRVQTLIKKYTEDKIYWYVEYPGKGQWSIPFQALVFEEGLKTLFSSQSAPLLYIHMPYCIAQCYFCNCKTIISSKYEDVKNYLAYLTSEVGLYEDFCQKHGLESNIREMHMGGGSPTYIKREDFEVLMNRLSSIVNFDDLTEFSIEVDPRRVGPKRMHFYKEMGVNRISFGIQDFDPEVQKAVNRTQQESLIKRMLTPDIRGLFKNGINFDIICGLPGQTSETFKRTIDKVIELSPDRISLLTLGLVPDFSPHQLLMPLNKIPDACRVKSFFFEALKMLSENGYVRVSYEHFAKPEDEVTIAREKGKITWTGLGTTPGRYSSVLGLGVTAQSTMGPRYYSQNYYELQRWQEAIVGKSFPLYRGYKLSDDDILRREIIQTLKVHFLVSYSNLEKEYDIHFHEYFADEISRLKMFVDDEMVELDDDSLRITEYGSLFTDLICRVFDSYA